MSALELMAARKWRSEHYYEALAAFAQWKRDEKKWLEQERERVVQAGPLGDEPQPPSKTSIAAPPKIEAKP